ncbi:MAG: alpha-amylase family glycosyl hydrolase [Bacteroidota bacterium]
MVKILIFLLAFLFTSCHRQSSNSSILDNPNEASNFSFPPSWADDVIWYEIAVERFRNGDRTNDPTLADIKGTYPGFIPEDWQITPWEKDWYSEDPYFKSIHGKKDSYGNVITKFVDKVQLRRYGGDLQGVLDKMDYLDSLGVSAIYFRPLNDAPSLHKYDARNWRHIDVNFGPSPEQDKATIASEVPDDPSTWKLTSADKLFIEILEEFHSRGIRVILDFSWNHTGTQFWAWKDILENQRKSKYNDWYWIEAFDDESTTKDEFKYHGWSGVPSLPEIKETKKQNLSIKVEPFEGNIYSSTAKEHIFNVTRRWLDPNGDGETSDGVDGYRLDVAAETPLGFWREFRKHVREINPEAYLVGEIWWEKWPDKLLDPEPFLKGDVFDAVMNYRWYKSVRQFFNESPTKITSSDLIDSLNAFTSNIGDKNDYAMMNYTGGFDTPRILTSLFNRNKYKFGTKAHENPEYKIHKPDLETLKTLKLLLIQQYTYIGAPHIYAGDEMGMWGADDPSSRKPLIWPDFEFEDEIAHPLNKLRPVDKVRFNSSLFDFYRSLIQLRKDNPVLVDGSIEYLEIKGNPEVLAYRRFNGKSEVLVIFNHTQNPMEVALPTTSETMYHHLLSGGGNPEILNDKALRIEARSAILLNRISTVATN